MRCPTEINRRVYLGFPTAGISSWGGVGEGGYVTHVLKINLSIDKNVPSNDDTLFIACFMAKFSLN